MATLVDIEETSIQRITLGHYADQLKAGIERVKHQLDRIDGGRTEPDNVKQQESLTTDLNECVSELSLCGDRLAEIADRIGRVR